MNTIHGKFMALALVALAGTTIDSMALASEDPAQSDQDGDDAVSDPGDEGIDIQAVRATCPRTIDVCRSGAVYFPGGRITITADVMGGGTGRWLLSSNGAPTSCRATFSAVDPPRTWGCTLARGTYTLLVYSGQSGQWAEGTLSW